MSDIARLKARLAASNDLVDWEPPSQETAPDPDDLLLQAINTLSDKIDCMADCMVTSPQESVEVDMTPIVGMLKDVVEIQKQMAKKRTWKFKIKQNKDGDLDEVIAKEQ